MVRSANRAPWVMVALCVLLLCGQRARAADQSGGPDQLYRLFLLGDAEPLVCVGEPAVVDDRVIALLPSASTEGDAPLQMVSLSITAVDLARSRAYADGVRARRYVSSRAEADYQAMATDVARLLDAVGHAPDVVARLRLVEQARRQLVEWPRTHYGYWQEDVSQMLPMLDEAVNGLRAQLGGDSFDLSLSVTVAPPTFVPALPAPTAQDLIRQTVTAAGLTLSLAERRTLLNAARADLARDGALASSPWGTDMRASIDAQLSREAATDAGYEALGARVLPLAQQRATRGDVRGVSDALDALHRGDAALGAQRPELMRAFDDQMSVALEPARQTRLEHDRWLLRASSLRAYRAAMADPEARFRALARPLQDIKAMTGSTPDALGALIRETARLRTSLARIAPPAEAAAAHDVFVSAVRLAEQAARVRREAAVARNLGQARDASAAAAGAWMLYQRAREEVRRVTAPPATMSRPAVGGR